MTHYQLVENNKRRSAIIIILFIGFISLVSYVIAVGFELSLGIVGIALIFSGMMSLVSYWYSDKIILSLSGAKPAKRDEYFDLYTITENLSSSQRIPKPRVYVINDPAPNAFATGRNPEHGVVCVTTGLLEKLTRGELEGVIAHELSHIKNYDILLMSIVTILVGLVALLSDFALRMSFFGGNRRSGSKDSGQLQVIMFIAAIFLAILSPIIAKIIQLAISRRREFLADSSGVAMTKNPEGLARALEKISADHNELKTATNATAHLFFANPLNKNKSKGHFFASLFNTHPPVQERLKALRGL
jgi:heat shock protein HtpX